MIKLKKHMVAIMSILIAVLITGAVIYAEKSASKSKENQAVKQESSAKDDTAVTNANSQTDDSKKEEVIKSDKVEVTKVVDVNTLTVKLENGNSEKVKLLGVSFITTSATSKSQKNPLTYLKEKLEGKTIYLEKDELDKDKSGKLLRLVWLEMPEEISQDSIESKLLNAMVLKDGYAKIDTTVKDAKYKEYFTEIEKSIKTANASTSTSSTTKTGTTTTNATDASVTIDNKTPARDTIIHITAMGKPDTKVTVTCHYKTKAQTYTATVNKDGKGIVPINIGSSISGYKVIADVSYTGKDGKAVKTQTFFTPK